MIDPTTFETVCLIELDDKSHSRFNRIERDRFVNQVMEQTGIPLFRFKVKRRYDRSEIKEKLEGCFQ